MKRSYYGHPRLDYQEPMSKLGLYKKIAADYGAVLEQANAGVSLTMGGAITAVAIPMVAACAMRDALRVVGANARIVTDDPSSECALVYLSTGSFVKGDQL